MSDCVQTLFESQLGTRIYSDVAYAIEKYGMHDMLCRGALVGFSGGADSVMLLSFLVEYRRRNSLDFPILAVHINHMLRGDEADRDEHFARLYAESLGVEFISQRVNVAELSRIGGMGVEETARNARYSIFEDIIRSRNDIYVISTAHNASDNVETVIFNISRGSGARGASGIAPVRGNVIRPLIHVAGADIRDALDTSGVKYVIDSTNYSTDYSRNYIRHEILPKLERINKKYVYAFSAFSDSVRDDVDFIRTSAEAVIRENFDSYINREVLISLHPALFAEVLSLLAKGAGINALEKKHVLNISDMLKGDNFRLSVGYKCSFICERSRCYFAKEQCIKDEIFRQVLTDGENKLHGYAGSIFVGENGDNSSLNVYKISIHADVSSAIIVGSLYVRFRRDGDSYFYGGMTHKIKKVLNDKKIPPSHRDRIPVICDEKGIVWVPGLGVRDDGVEKDGRKPRMITFCIPYNSDDKELFAAIKT